MRSSLVAISAIAALAVSACGSGESPSDDRVGTDAGDKIAASDSSSDSSDDGGDDGENADGDSDAPDVEIVDYSFTQSDEYVTGIALLKANSDRAVGQFVTLSYNVLDKSGQILATEEQIESFSWSGQEIGFPIFVSLDGAPGAKAASIDPVASFDQDGGGGDQLAPLPVLDATSVTKDEYGNGFTASFGFTNDSDEPLESMRVAAVCFNDAGKVVGGETAYPDVLPGRTVRIDIEMIRVPGNKKPAACKAYLNYPA